MGKLNTLDCEGQVRRLHMPIVNLDGDLKRDEGI